MTLSISNDPIDKVIECLECGSANIEKCLVHQTGNVLIRCFTCDTRMTLSQAFIQQAQGSTFMQPRTTVHQMMVTKQIELMLECVLQNVKTTFIPMQLERQIVVHLEKMQRAGDIQGFSIWVNKEHGGDFDPAQVSSNIISIDVESDRFRTRFLSFRKVILPTMRAFEPPKKKTPIRSIRILKKNDA